MILNQTTLNNAIAKAKCCLANKTIEYFDKLSIGIDKDCLFKESIVLKGYIETLSDFQIVGSKTTCDCCIDGNYNFQIDDSPLGQGIQFLCDGTGYTIVDGVPYLFTWSNDINSNKIYIYLPMDDEDAGMNIPEWLGHADTVVLINGTDIIFSVNNGVGTTEDFIEQFNNTEHPDAVIKNTTGIVASLSEDGTKLIFTGPPEFTNLTLVIDIFSIRSSVGLVTTPMVTMDYTFDSNCNLNISNAPLFYTSSITNTYGPIEDTNGVINIYDNLDNIVHHLEIPYSILQDPVATVEYWSENSNSGFTLGYDNFTYTLYSPAFGHYFDWTFELDITSAPFNSNVVVTTYGFFKQQVTITLGNGQEYQSDLFNAATISDLLPLIQAWLVTLPVSITCTLNGNTLKFIANSNDVYGGNIVVATSSDLEDFNYIGFFTSPTQTSKFFVFEDNYKLQSANPCEVSIVEQSCLSNNQILEIIKNINKICKNC